MAHRSNEDTRFDFFFNKYTGPDEETLELLDSPKASEWKTNPITFWRWLNDVRMPAGDPQAYLVRCFLGVGGNKDGHL